MGLDMTLHRKHYYGGQYRKKAEELKEKGEERDGLEGHTLKIDGKFVKENGIDLDKIDHITEVVMYWRKANAIHDWFDRNCRREDPIANCEPVYVTGENLRDLVATCHEVLVDNTKAEELLPTTSGFFFGGTDYDEYYYDELKRTIKVLEPILKEYPDAEFEYSAWW
jgi:hypothetical protein